MTFSKETKQAICEAQNFYCKVDGCLKPIHSIHHKLNNCRVHRVKYPKFLSSPMNAIGLCISCHTHKSHLFRITPEEGEVYENFLRGLKDGRQSR